MSDFEREDFMIHGQEREGPLYMSTKTPQLECMPYDYAYVYEIDFDRNVFHINQVPFFSLDNLPPHGTLDDLVVYDLFFNDACHDPKYRFESVQPPAFGEAALHTYHQLLDDSDGKGGDVSYIDILGLLEHRTEREQVRLHLLQLIAGSSMVMAKQSIREFRLVAGKDELSDQAWQDAFAVGSAAFAPPIFFSVDEPNGQPPPPKRGNVCWIRRDIFIHITPHLSDKNYMQAAISRVVEEVLKQDNKGKVFGVLFSFIHCVIVQIDITAGGKFTQYNTYRIPPIRVYQRTFDPWYHCSRSFRISVSP
ncbi:hypothetical protein BJ138DRAFT_735856 [Hygrophoropsis aurantiaca]|uniref:Uncharacterized protein n=1 Tax=Hygrophoropsis aurantiaca TaxID=72124 RepID=A0ACB7ZXR8_9AGAM|nr:hypothetical protein BJ138DRAFT_735856 [Hygrophoropsis aurantiaca]